MSTNPARRNAIQAIASQPRLQGSFDFRNEKIDLIYGQNVFSLDKMEKRLPKDVFKSLKASIESGTKLDHAVADVVAAAIKDWALERGATHYAHVFYPLTGFTAEKHDTFFEPNGNGTLAASPAASASRTSLSPSLRRNPAGSYFRAAMVAP